MSTAGKKDRNEDDELPTFLHMDNFTLEITPEELLALLVKTLAILRRNRRGRFLSYGDVYRANAFVIDMVSHADVVERIHEVTTIDIRRFVSAEDMLYLSEENELLEMGPRRN